MWSVFSEPSGTRRVAHERKLRSFYQGKGKGFHGQATSVILGRLGWKAQENEKSKFLSMKNSVEVKRLGRLLSVTQVVTGFGEGGMAGFLFLLIHEALMMMEKGSSACGLDITSSAFGGSLSASQDKLDHTSCSDHQTYLS